MNLALQIDKAIQNTPGLSIGLKIALASFIGVMIYFIIIKIISKISNKKRNISGKKIVQKIKYPFVLVLMILGAQIPITTYQKEYEFLVYTRPVLNVLLIFSIAWLLIQIIAVIKMIMVTKFDVSEADNYRARKAFTQIQVAQRVLTFLILFLAFAASLMTFEEVRELGVSLFASAGIGGIIIGFAAQKVIGSFLAGVQIAITQPIKLDDVVIVEGEWGWVEEINLTYVVVKVWDQRRVILPTPYFLEKPFQNWTKTSADLLGTVFVYTDYKIPIEDLRKFYEDLIHKQQLWDGRVQNLQVTNATSDTVELRFMMSAINSPVLWDLRVKVREEIIKYIQDKYPEHLPRTRVELKKPDNQD
ncbi:mechanosensitive ion channel [Mangrovivirga sp. M17]|uniref:Mechanosensitive ion channel n=1 Tax=Mangrovivirga halotolerans TaxID=2993936 RepID=A0ABT3RPP9_9BACT|nr:mechanosensitive ion channel domain-containing protein [Mangrovivirga halotolerans]MCX2743508.1 mechanosensitive ion channel [Mangrovivirga halotolerans]